MQSAHLLRYAAVPRYRRGNEKGVKVGQIEALAQKAFGGDDDSMFMLKAGKDCSVSLFFLWSPISPVKSMGSCLRSLSNLNSSSACFSFWIV